VTEAEEAMDTRIGEKKRFLQEMAKGVVGFLRVKFGVCQEGTVKRRFGEWRRSWEQGQNRKLMTFIVPSKDSVLIFFVSPITFLKSPRIKAPMKIIFFF